MPYKKKKQLANNPSALRSTLRSWASLLERFKQNKQTEHGYFFKPHRSN